MLTVGLFDGFEKFQHISVTMLPWNTPSIPHCDVAVVHTYICDVQEVATRIRLAGVKSILFLEVGSSLVDCSFVYGRITDNQKQVKVVAPVVGAQMQWVQKTPRTVLFDHMWPSDAARLSWARCIKATEPLVDRFKFYQIDRRDSPVAERPEWITPLPFAEFSKYLEQTATMENFVVTHAGSYNHSLVDMAARGVRVLAFDDLVQNDIADDIGVIRATTDDGLRSALLEPVDAGRLQAAANRFTDMVDVVKMMDAKVQEWSCA